MEKPRSFPKHFVIFWGAVHSKMRFPCCGFAQLHNIHSPALSLLWFSRSCNSLTAKTHTCYQACKVEISVWLFCCLWPMNSDSMDLTWSISLGIYGIHSHMWMTQRIVTSITVCLCVDSWNILGSERCLSDIGLPFDSAFLGNGGNLSTKRENLMMLHLISLYYIPGVPCGECIISLRLAMSRPGTLTVCFGSKYN